MRSIAVLRVGDSLLVQAKTRTMTLDWKDLAEYQGERALRGRFLSRNYRKVVHLSVNDQSSESE